MSNLAKLEKELAQAEEDVATCNDMLAISPDDADALAGKSFYGEHIAELKSQIAAIKAKSAPAPATGDAPPPPPVDDEPPPPPKWDASKHPKLQKPGEALLSEDAPQQVFNVKDLVMAKWSEDKQWYQATIISKLGSSSDPVYTVSFKGYNNTETKRKHEVRAFVENSKKRKADGITPSATTPTISSVPASPKPGATTNSGSVISAAPSVDPTLVQKREPSKVSDGPTRMAPEPKKLKGNKALEKAKSSWSDWQKSGPKKAPAAGMSGSVKKKDSQFRTPDLPGAKVGFTGSGKGMKKDQARAKWNYQAGEEEE